MTMARQARAEATREGLIRSAGFVFSTRSYAQATLKDVLRDAGMTQGALYFHFDSKRTLALEVIQRQHSISIAAGESILGKNLSGIESMILMSKELARQITTDPIVRGGLRLSTESADVFPEYASRPYLDWIALGETLVERGVSEGDIRATPTPLTLARFVISAFTGVQTVSQATAHWKDIDERLAEMWELVFDAIVTPDRRETMARADALIRDSSLD